MISSKHGGALHQKDAEEDGKRNKLRFGGWSDIIFEPGRDTQGDKPPAIIKGFFFCRLFFNAVQLIVALQQKRQMGSLNILANELPTKTSPFDCVLCV